MAGLMDVKLALACDYASVSLDQKLNIMGTFSDVTVLAFPAALPPFFLVTAYEAHPAEFGSHKNLRIVFMDQDGQELGNIEQPITVQPGPMGQGRPVTVNHIVRLDSIVVPRPGPYQFTILVNGEVKETVAIHVHGFTPTPGA